MQYGDRSQPPKHCHSVPPSSQGGTVITVPIGGAKEDCCAELRAEIKALKEELARINRRLAALPDFASIKAGVLTSNGAIPAEIKSMNLPELAKAISPLIEVERDVFLDAFENPIPSRPA
jgi:hypothetical protein